MAIQCFQKNKYLLTTFLFTFQRKTIYPISFFFTLTVFVEHACAAQTGVGHLLAVKDDNVGDIKAHKVVESSQHQTCAQKSFVWVSAERSVVVL